MHDYYLSFKRAIRCVYFPLLLILLALSLIVSIPLGKSEDLPPAGICDLDGSESSSRICAYLTDNHFVLCDTEADLRNLVASGKLNCGILIPQGLEDALLRDDVAGALRFLTSPATFLAPLYKNHAAAALFTEHAAVISAGALAEAGIPREELMQAYREMMDEGILFSFEMEYASAPTGTDPMATQRSRSYALSAASLIVFVIILYSVRDLLLRDMLVLPQRIGMRHTLLHAVIPHMITRAAGILLAAGTAAGISYLWYGDTVLASLILPISLYIPAVFALALLLIALTKSSSTLEIGTFVVVMASFALCPIYLDTALLSPTISYLRPLCPTYWLWMLCDSLAPAWLLALALPLSMFILCVRWSGKRRKTK